MIEISVNGYEIKATGHAMYCDEKGKDIVCAAVSALLFTLSDSLNTLSFALEEGSLKVDLMEGNARIRCVPKEEYEANIQMVYWTILNGLKSVSESYADNVSLTFSK